jgi:LysM repeat protein
MQAQLCLTPAHERCERFLQFVARSGVPRPGRAEVADGFVSTRMLLTPEPTWRGIAGRARRARSGALLGVGAGALVLGAAGLAAANAAASGGLDLGRLFGAAPTTTPTVTPALSPDPTPTVRPTPSPAPTSSATPESTPQPTPVPTLVPTPVPTVAPTPPLPPAQTTYVVQQGDTLAAIAQRFGTSVAAIQAANGIADPNQIVVGQVLVIP